MTQSSGNLIVGDTSQRLVIFINRHMPSLSVMVRLPVKNKDFGLLQLAPVNDSSVSLRENQS